MGLGELELNLLMFSRSLAGVVMVEGGYCGKMGLGKVRLCGRRKSRGRLAPTMGLFQRDWDGVIAPVAMRLCIA